MKTVTRFAPSPSGDLHLGGARTALFNFLFAKSKKGQFLLRIEDTDVQRNKKESVNSIIKGLEWLKLDIDKKIIFQSENKKNHLEFVSSLLKKGIAYKCFEQNRLKIKTNKNLKFRSKWREIKEKNHPKNQNYTIRLKIPENQNIEINDMVQGKVVVNSNEIDDYVLIRNNGNPTFLLASAVDDISMGVTDIIRGDDHLTNTFRQNFLYSISDKKLPNFAHIPLILNEKGEKLSKRDNVPSLLELKQKGYLRDAILNYLMRLGWSYGDKEILDLNLSVKIFDISNVRKSPSKLDKKKIDFLNQYYLKKTPVDEIYNMLVEYLAGKKQKFLEDIKSKLLIYLPDFIERSVTITDLYNQLNFLIENSNYMVNSKYISEEKIYKDEIIKELEKIKIWNLENIKKCLLEFTKKNEISFKNIGIPIRITLTGSLNSPSIFNVMLILGKKEVLNRLIKLW